MGCRYVPIPSVRLRCCLTLSLGILLYINGCYDYQYYFFSSACVEDLFDFGTKDVRLHLRITNTFLQRLHRSNFLCCSKMLFNNETKVLVLKKSTNTSTSLILVHSQLFTLFCCSTLPKCFWHWPRQIVQPMYKFPFVLHLFLFFCLPYIFCFTLFPFWLVT